MNSGIRSEEDVALTTGIEAGELNSDVKFRGFDDFRRQLAEKSRGWMQSSTALCFTIDVK